MAPDFLHITSSWNLTGFNQNPASIIAKQTTQICSLEMMWSMLPRKLGRSKELGMCVGIRYVFILAFLRTMSLNCERGQNLKCWILSGRFHHCTDFITVLRLVWIPFFICRIYNITKEFPSKEKEKEKVKAVEGEDFVTVWLVFTEEYM